MMSHMLEPALLAAQAKIMVEAGATGVYVVDSAGALILDDAAQRVAALSRCGRRTRPSRISRASESFARGGKFRARRSRAARS